MICFIIVYIMRWQWVSQSQSNEEQFQVCHPPPPPKVCCRRGQGREALEWPYTMGGGGGYPPPSHGPPANKDGAHDTKEQDDQKDQGSEPAGQQRPQEQLPARHQHHQQAQELQHEIVQDNKKHNESALPDSDRGHTASAETGQGSKETPTAGTVTRAWFRRAQLQVDQQGKQNPHCEQPQRTPDQQGVPQHLHTGWQALGVVAGTVVAAVIGVVSRMGRNAQGFLWGMSDATWNGCRVQVLDTTKEGLLVHVVEGTLSQGDEQAGRMLEVPRGAFGGWALNRQRQHTQSRQCPATSRSSQGKTAKWCAGMSSK